MLLENCTAHLREPVTSESIDRGQLRLQHEQTI
jgi:hypothetical protein